MMDSEDIIGLIVWNVRYGRGVITRVEEDCVMVLFDSEKTERKLTYPYCFKSFLILFDDAQRLQFQSDINEDMEEYERSGKTGFTEVDRESYDLSEALHCTSVATFGRVYRKAVLAEKTYVQRKGGKKNRLINGSLIERSDMSYSYAFETEEELHIPSDTKASLWRGEEYIPATVVYCEDYSIMLVTRHYLGDKVDSIELSAEPWKLLEQLNEHILRYEMNTPDIVKMMVCEGWGHQKSGVELIEGQAHAVDMSLNQPITFVWGPPGTGKTQTLAKIALDHIERGNRILMVSYSNVSVDGAVLRVHSLAQDCVDDEGELKGKIVRYGYPRAKEILDHEYLTAYNWALHQSPQLLKRRDELVAKRAKLKRNTKEYKEVKDQEDAIRKQLKEKEREIVENASFVATTVSKAIADKTLYEGDFDVVIFDEASMAYIPQVVFAAGLAKKHFVCLGDFKQLPPIVTSGENSVLNYDIFEFCGITDAVEHGKAHDWLCMLSVQHRMQPTIAKFASKTMYNDKLLSKKGLSSERKSIVECAPFEHYSMGLIDLSGIRTICIKAQERSRVNVLSAFLTVGCALKAAQHHEVGVITPYNAQSRLLSAMVRDVAPQENMLHSITCATVHQFQGSEKDVIIYDAVDCFVQTEVGKMLKSTTRDLANRLFNVALSRARGKFIALAHMSFMKHHKLKKSLMFAQLLGNLENNEQRCLRGSAIKNVIADNNVPAYKVYSEEQAIQQYFDDIDNAKQEVRIEIPKGCPENNCFIQELTNHLKHAIKRKVAVVIRAEEKDDVPTILRRYVEWEGMALNPVTVIDYQVIWYGMPLSNAVFRTKKVTEPITYRPLIRFVGTNTARALYGFLGLDVGKNRISEVTTVAKNGFAQYVENEVKCKQCGNPMSLTKNKKGVYYLKCSNKNVCKARQYVTTEMVEKYLSSCGPQGLRCEKCGLSLEAKKGPNGVYVKCGSIAEHTFSLGKI